MNINIICCRCFQCLTYKLLTLTICISYGWPENQNIYAYIIVIDNTYYNIHRYYALYICNICIQYSYIYEGRKRDQFEEIGSPSYEVDILNCIGQAGNSGRVLNFRLEAKFLLPKAQFWLLSLSTGWMSPIHIFKHDLLYLKSADFRC